MKTAICPKCNKEFKRKTNSQKYCSEKCRKSSYYERVTRAKCEYCGIFTNLYGSPYCSVECMEKAFSKISKVLKKPKISLEEAVRKSREEGLTYGKYVQLHNLE